MPGASSTVHYSLMIHNSIMTIFRQKTQYYRNRRRTTFQFNDYELMNFIEYWCVYIWKQNVIIYIYIYILEVLNLWWWWWWWWWWLLLFFHNVTILTPKVNKYEHNWNNKMYCYFLSIILNGTNAKYFWNITTQQYNTFLFCKNAHVKNINVFHQKRHLSMRVISASLLKQCIQRITGYWKSPFWLGQRQCRVLWWPIIFLQVIRQQISLSQW